MIKVGDLVRVRGGAVQPGLEDKIGFIVSREKKSDSMKYGKDGDFFYMRYYKVLVDGKIYRLEKSNLERINNG